MKKIFAFYIISSIFLSFFSGCSAKIDLLNENATGLLEGNDLRQILKQIGRPKAKVFETFSLTEDQLTDMDSGREWLLPTTREIEGEEFTQELLFDNHDPYNLLIFRCTFHPEEYDEDEFRELAVSIALKAAELYGKPLHYEGHNLLDDEGNRAKELGRMGDFIEIWELSKDEALRMQVNMNFRYIWLNYRVQNGMYLEYLKPHKPKKINKQ